MAKKVNVADAVQRAYRWAFEVSGNHKSTCMELYCAKQISEAVETNELPTDAFAAIEKLIEEWRARRKAPLDSIADIVGKMTGHCRKRAESATTSDA